MSPKPTSVELTVPSKPLNSTRNTAILTRYVSSGLLMMEFASASEKTKPRNNSDEEVRSLNMRPHLVNDSNRRCSLRT